RELVAALVHGTVAIQAARKRQRRPFGREARDQFWHRTGTESVKIWLRLRREELDHLQPAVSIGYQGELAGANHANLNVIGIFEFPIRVKTLVEDGVLRPGDIHDH